MVAVKVRGKDTILVMTVEVLTTSKRHQRTEK
jgi:hypothetical protein